MGHEWEERKEGKITYKACSKCGICAESLCTQKDPDRCEGDYTESAEVVE